MKSHGFIIIDVKTGEILSGQFKTRVSARKKLAEMISKFRTERRSGDYEYQTGRFSNRLLGIHHIELYPGETYDRSTYRP